MGPAEYCLVMIASVLTDDVPSSFILLILGFILGFSTAGYLVIHFGYDGFRR